MTTFAESYVHCHECFMCHHPGEHLPLYHWRESENFGPDEWQPIRAESFRDAALRAARIYDKSIRMDIVKRGIRVELVIRHEDGRIQGFSVTGDLVPEYYVRATARATNKDAGS